MARSTYVYVVTTSGTPIAAFTVKHELISWLRRKNGGPLGAIVRRLPDGASDLTQRVDTVMDITELLDAKCGATRNTVDHKPCILPPSHRWGCKSE